MRPGVGFQAGDQSPDTGLLSSQGAELGHGGTFLAEPVCDRQGRVVGWLDGDNIRDLHRDAQAFVYGENVISYRGGGHRGWFVAGVFRDRGGRAVAFVREASGITIPGLGGIPGVPGSAEFLADPAFPASQGARGSGAGATRRSRSSCSAGRPLCRGERS